jgi:putative FmdB family regulatory protein
MPTYEYACASCKNEWEEVQKISAPALEECPACKQKTAKRQISGGNFILKGGGWYADAYSSAKPSASKKEGDSASSGSSSDGKSASTASNDKGTSESKSAAPTKSEPASASKSEKSESKGPTGGGSGGGSSPPGATRAA